MEEKGVLRCHLSEIMGQRKLKIVDVMNASGVGRFQVSRLYRERSGRASRSQTDCRFPCTIF